LAAHHSDDRWVVPLGGGGRVFKIGPRPLNMSLQSYYNVKKPHLVPDWSLRFRAQDSPVNTHHKQCAL
jgi:hypothetical protein